MFVKRIFNKNLYNNFKFVRAFGIQANISKENANLEISSETRKHHFPIVWLRDNCRCSQCFNAVTNSRSINWEKFDPQVQIQAVKTNSKNVEITWKDDHRSVFDYEWLQKRSFVQEDQENYLKCLEEPKRLWGKKEFQEIFQTYQYNDVMKSDQTLCQYLIALAQNGIVLLDEVPENEDECLNFANRIGISRSTHYGKTYQVRAKKNATHVAYQPSVLQLHTDLPFYKYKPGATVLHCLQQAKDGGQNLLTDAFYVAEKLRRENKKAFDILTQVEVNWFDEGTDTGKAFNKVTQIPIIVLNSRGNVVDINHNVMKRDSHFTTSIENVKEWYRAMKIFVQEIYEHAVDFRLKSGQMLVFDNTRLLHGRRSFEDIETSSRLLIGTYVDWDELNSNIRILKQCVVDKAQV